MNETKKISPTVDLGSNTAIVTGASRGIGRAVAIYLADCNAKIAAWARDEQELLLTCEEIKSHGGVCLPISVDVTDASQVERAMEKTIEALGTPTLLVNSAGRGHCIGPVWETDPDDWWSDIEVNLRGTFLCSRAALKVMVARGQGRIVNISSAAGNMTLPMNSAYACSKAAVQRLTDCLAAAAKPHCVKIFSMSPGPTKTAMTQHIVESPAGRKWMPEFQNIPPAQWTPPEVIGKLVATLASGRADALSGRFIHIRHNIEELVANIDEIRAKDLYTLRLRE